MNNEHNYRNQFEDQVKDLIRKYTETHGYGPAVTIEWEEPSGKIKMEEELQRHPALSKSASFSPTDYDKGFILGWRLSYERIFNKQEPVQPAPATPTPDVLPPDTSGRIAVCNACSNEKHGVKTRIAVKHTCGK